MVLIKCLECSQERAYGTKLPHCGVPRIATQSQMDEVSQQKNQVKKSNANYFIIGIVVFIISFFMLLIGLIVLGVMMELVIRLIICVKAYLWNLIFGLERLMERCLLGVTQMFL